MSLFRADGAAFSEGDFSIGAVAGFLADYIVTEDLAIVADADLAGLGFPDVFVLVLLSILHAALSVRLIVFRLTSSHH